MWLPAPVPLLPAVLLPLSYDLVAWGSSLSADVIASANDIVAGAYENERT